MTIDHQSLAALIDSCMLRDQRALRRRLRDLTGPRAPAASARRPAPRATPDQPDSQARLVADIERSAQRRRDRQFRLPTPRFPEDLPVVQRREEIQSLIAAHQVIVLCGETGSGKTTQLPKLCLALGRAVGGMIGHTQPRRIAARSVATRIAQELASPLGRDVGYKVRFGDHTSPDAFIKVMTDGVLLAETQSDRLLEAYDTLIIDEAHERSLNIDFLLGFIHQLLPRRPDLKVIITSATIDPERFSKRFTSAAGTPAPIIEVSGRVYPVEVRYRPIETAARATTSKGIQRSERAILEDADRAMHRAVVAAMDEIASLPPRAGPEDVLVFLSGEREIRETAEALRKHHLPANPAVELLPLYARLTADEQMRVFQSPGPGIRRRIVLATNVAETSLTVPRIRYVIDTGLARLSRYSSRTKVQRLPVEPISQASADQRKGRCGRISDGLCFRLYSEEDFNQRPEFTDPEIVRTNLASVILQMTALRLGRVEDFPFLDPPDARMVRDGYDTLVELGAVDDKGRLTRLGADLARLPVDPRLARMILAASVAGCLDDVLIIAAALSVQDPRERPMDQQEAADQAHAQFRDETSDFLAYLKLWSFFHELAKKLSKSQLRKECKRRYLSFVRLREWHDVQRQLTALVKTMGLRTAGASKPRDAAAPPARPSSERPAPAAAPLPGAPSPAQFDPVRSAPIHRALLSGLLSNLGMLGDANEYTGARSSKFSIFPGSSLFRSRPKWVMSAELVRTTKLYARTVARIDPKWIEDSAAHLVKRTYTEPLWTADRGEVFALERVALFGLEIVSGRRVRYGPIEPKIARELFIQHALVENDARWPREPAFIRHNTQLLQEIQTLEAKARRRDLVADARARFEFFERRLPEGVWSVAAFETWRREAERRDQRILFMSKTDLALPASEEVTPDRFPDAMTMPARPSPAARPAPAASPPFQSRDVHVAPSPAPTIASPSSLSLPLEYRFDPVSADDGVTLRVPLEALDSIDPRRCEWLTPGLLIEKLAALIKALPKDIRRSFVPAPDFAQKAAAIMPFAEGDLLDSLSNALHSLTGVEVPRADWGADELPEHLRLNFRIVDDSGKPLAAGRDLAPLRENLSREIDAAFQRAAREAFHREGITAWDFPDLPESMEFSRNSLRFRAFPALLDAGDSVEIRLMRSEEGARRASRAGLRRLVLLQFAGEINFQIESMGDSDRLTLLFASLASAAVGPSAGASAHPQPPRRADFNSALAELIADRAFLCEFDSSTEPIRTKTQFDALLESGWNRLTDAASHARALIERILDAHHTAALALSHASRGPVEWADALRDIRAQLLTLTAPGFLVDTPYEWLIHYPRYLSAIRLRLQKLASAGAARDRKLAADIAPLWDACQSLLHRRRTEGAFDPALELRRWLIEELRVSLFAQELGVSTSVSLKRLEKQWSEIRQ